MIAVALTGAQLRRPTWRAVAGVAVVAGGWTAWSPGTAFGLAGLWGGWQFAGRHLLDIGLVLLAVVGALAGAGVRERRLDEHLHAAGVGRVSVLGATVVTGSAVAAIVAAVFAAGTAIGGLVRSVTRGGSTWVDPDHAVALAPALLTVGRLVTAAALVGASAALVGWLVRREDLAVAVVVVLSLPALEQTSALLGRMPSIIDGWMFTPLGALRTVALADRGLSAPGYDRPTEVAVPAAVLAAWLVTFVVLALRPSAGRVGSTVIGIGSASDADRRAPSRRRPRSGRGAARSSSPFRPRSWSSPGSRPARHGLVVASWMVAAVLTVFAGAVLPARMADSLPWRWQRSWREATHQGWSSTQTVDRVVRAVRQGDDLGPRVSSTGSVGPAVADSLRRASRVDRQPESTMRGPEQVTVRLHFDDPVVSGRAAFSDYLVRFSLEADEGGHWLIVGAEGPVAATAADRDAGGPR